MMFKCAEWVILTLLAAGVIYLVVDDYNEDQARRDEQAQVIEIK